MDVIKCADWVIDLGPEAGDAGGEIVFEGTPAQLMNCERSYTGRFLARHEGIRPPGEPQSPQYQR